MTATIHDVANRANVSISTVSRVVNNPNAVRVEKRERVLQAIKELGYEPNPFASGLRDNRTMTIAAIIPDISNPFFSSLLRGIEDVARKKKNNVIICNTEQDDERFREYMLYFKKKKIDGVIFTSATISDYVYQSFQELKKPAVLAATRSEDHNLPFVKINDWQASYDATNFLIRNGHTSIGMISGSLSDPIAGKPRYDGFYEALKEANLPISAQSVTFGNLDFDSGYEAMGKLYAQMPEITAVFAASDLMALGAMSFLQKREIQIPKHISMIGFDNIDFSRMVSPGLTTVSQPIYEIGKKSASLLFQYIEQKQAPESLYLDHELKIRHTVFNKN
ncbi:LacI family DNA-binding transcriptional regulator [Chengkuizengella axinellae]|uniref:LacI family DNA-binding transcriptional regulator n=1 Tax=Chengkuizengella axinellae TaxID=3064388 RepID=A0ABT9J1Q8_9BACL|nr:LacI family DNA-binding transcriptional regulator [Chengkuizengella sp. 2205SS18-9]MDP5275554.1 LacI family DNA-binding transcriptional regulator [Chengkuizengella sp. 2205SS18-9]